MIRVLFVLGLLLAFPAMMAQPVTDAPRSITIEDAEGDLQYDPEAPAGAALDEEYSNVDIVRLIAGPDTEVDIPIVLEFKGSSEIEGSYENVGKQRIRIDFSIEGAQYFVDDSIHPCNGLALFSKIPASRNGHLLSCIESTRDHETNEVHIRIPKSHLTTAEGLPVSAEMELDDASAMAYRRVVRTSDDEDTQYTQVWAYDFVPDAGTFAIHLEAGSSASNNASFAVTALDPLRATNGAASTFRYDLQINNLDSSSKHLTISTRDLWDSAKVYANKTLEVGPRGTVVEPVYVSIPFGHKHGDTNWVWIRYTSAQGEWGEARIGVHWLKVPQPAGHHSTIWLHSDESREQTPQLGSNDQNSALDAGFGWMNTLDEDPSPAATDAPLPGNAGGFGIDGIQPVTDYQWRFDLSPQLKLGLNLTPDSSSVFSGKLTHLAPGNERRLEGLLGLCRFDASAEGPSRYCQGQWVPLAQGSVDSQGVSDTDEWIFEVELAHVASDTLIPYQPENNMILYVLLDEVPGGVPREGGIVAPLLNVQDSMLELVLGEYTEDSPLAGLTRPSPDLPDEIAPDDPASDGPKKVPSVSIPCILALFAMLVISRRE